MSEVDTSLLDGQDLDALRGQMLRFAQLQLGDAHLAEDAVQEAMMGALKNARSFGGRAAFRTWVFAILKNKIADTFRQRRRLVYAGELVTDADDGQESVDALFEDNGAWCNSERPQRWGDPEAAFHEREFWQVFNVCLDDLPPRHARVLMMREFLELESGEICRELGVTVSNLHVMLHRARLRLRRCLETRWFALAGD